MAERSSTVAPKALAINGRFLGQAVSGVQRYGRELVRALDQLLLREEAPVFSSATIYVPPGVPSQSLPQDLKVLQIRQAGRLKGHLWEQIELPRLSRDALLVSLTNSAPAAHPHQFVVIHDAAIVQCPADYRWSYRTWYLSLYAALRRTSAQFITVSSFSADEIARRFGISAERISVIPNAAEQFLDVQPDLAVLDRLQARRGYILALGGGSGRKNLGLVGRALAECPRHPPLVIAGGGSSRAFSEAGSPLPAGSICLDRVSDAELKALYQNALCLVFPSRYEGFGLPPLEAMTCGCPVITSHAASMPEICGDAVLYCDPDVPDTLAAGIRRLMSDRVLRNQLTARGSRRARLFSWEQSASRLLEAVRSGRVTDRTISASWAGAAIVK